MYVDYDVFYVDIFHFKEHIKYQINIEALSQKETQLQWFFFLSLKGGSHMYLCLRLDSNLEIRHTRWLQFSSLIFCFDFLR